MELSKIQQQDFYDNQTERKNIPNGPGFQIRKLKILPPDSFDKLTTENQLLYLSHFGILAPSSHNTVPERISINPEKRALEIFLDRKFVLPESDAKGREACISLGCVLENIAIAGSCYSLEAKTKINQINQQALRTYKPSEERYTLLATISFSESKRQQDQSWLKTIIDRRVIRAEYNDSIKLDEKFIENIQESLQTTSPKIHLSILSNRLIMQQLAKYQEIADRTVFENDAFTSELGQWLLPNTDQNSIGMQGKEFGFDDSFALRIHNGLSKKTRLLPDEIAGFAASGKRMINSSSAVAIIACEEDTYKNWLDAGRAYENLALNLTRIGFSTTIHGGMVEVERVNKILQTTLKIKYRPAIIVRIGKPLREKDNHRPLSPRPNIEELLLKR